MLFSAILICALGLALLVYRYDMYEREPWYMLALASLLGAAACWLLGYGEDLVLRQLPGGGDSIAQQAAVAGVLEELFKLLVVLLIWGVVPAHFNDPFDGLIYGAMAGLGFGVAESSFYIQLQVSQPWAATAAQEAVRLFLHLIMGALTAVGLGLARFRLRGWPFWLAGWLASSIVIHFCWDYFCGLPGQDAMNPALQRATAVALLLIALALFGAAVVIARKHSGDTHAIHHLGDLWGWPFHYFARGRKRD